MVMLSPTLGIILGLIVGLMVATGVAFFLYRRAIAQHRQHAGDAERRAAVAEHLAELGTMTGGLAHEIKNPLSTIGLNAELLSEDIAELAEVSREMGVEIEVAYPDMVVTV